MGIRTYFPGVLALCKCDPLSYSLVIAHTSQTKLSCIREYIIVRRIPIRCGVRWLTCRIIRFYRVGGGNRIAGFLLAVATFILLMIGTGPIAYIRMFHDFHNLTFLTI
jgi:hypothetical protein